MSIIKLCIFWSLDLRGGGGGLVERGTLVTDPGISKNVEVTLCNLQKNKVTALDYKELHICFASPLFFHMHLIPDYGVGMPSPGFGRHLSVPTADL